MQNPSRMLIYFLKGSPNDTFKLGVYMNTALYTLVGIENGELFLMEIIKLANGDTTHATIGYLRESLTLLPSMVVKLNNGIKAMNK
jgi:hypothetical protein